MVRKLVITCDRCGDDITGEDARYATIYGYVKAKSVSNALPVHRELCRRCMSVALARILSYQDPSYECLGYAEWNLWLETFCMAPDRFAREHEPASVSETTDQMLVELYGVNPIGDLHRLRLTADRQVLAHDAEANAKLETLLHRADDADSALQLLMTAVMVLIKHFDLVGEYRRVQQELAAIVTAQKTTESS